MQSAFENEDIHGTNQLIYIPKNFKLSLISIFLCFIAAMFDHGHFGQLFFCLLLPACCLLKEIYLYSFDVPYSATQTRDPIRFNWASASKYRLDSLRIFINYSKSDYKSFLLPTTVKAQFSEKLGGHPGLTLEINDSKADFWTDALFRARPFVMKEELEEYRIFPFAVSPENYTWGTDPVKSWLRNCLTNITSYCFLRFDDYTPDEIAEAFYEAYYHKKVGQFKWQLHHKEWNNLGHHFLPFLEWSRILNVRKFERKPRQDAFIKDEGYFGKLYVVLLCVHWGAHFDYENIMPDPCNNPRVSFCDTFLAFF